MDSNCSLFLGKELQKGARKRLSEEKQKGLPQNISHKQAGTFVKKRYERKGRICMDWIMQKWGQESASFAKQKAGHRTGLQNNAASA